MRLEWNYFAGRRENFAIIETVNQIYHYLLARKFITKADTAIFTWMLSFKTLMDRLPGGWSASMNTTSRFIIAPAHFTPMPRASHVARTIRSLASRVPASKNAAAFPFPQSTSSWQRSRDAGKSSARSTLRSRHRPVHSMEDDK